MDHTADSACLYAVHDIMHGSERNLLREERLVATMFGNGHGQRAVASAPELGLGG